MRFFTTFFMSLILGTNLLAQSSIEGTVRTSDGNVLSQASILLNRQIGAISDDRGYFRVDNLEDGDYQLVVYYLGYKVAAKELDLGSNSVLKVDFVLEPSVFQSQEVVVSATRTYQVSAAVPASISTLSSKDIAMLPSQTIDEKFMYMPGVNIDRPFGIFGKSVVGIRGVVSSEPGRQLSLIDGVAINKSDGGGVNWNRIIQSDVERVEIVKGPGGSVYGNNAMGGTVNLITKRPFREGFSGLARAYYGTYNTMGAETNVMNYFGEAKKGFYFSASAKKSKSDGYVTVPEDMREASDTSVFMNDAGVNLRLGKDFGLNSNLEFEYNYFYDKRGQGTKIRLEDGSVVKYKTDFFKAKYTNKTGLLNYKINVFYQNENYEKDVEKLKKDNYSWYKVNSAREDYGVLLNATINLKSQLISFGSDVRLGKVDAVDAYQTSSDRIINKGSIDNYTLYFQDQIFMFSNRLNAIIGGNILFSKFHSALFDVVDGTGVTSVQQENADGLDEKQWTGFSPKIALQYNVNSGLNIYGSYSSGFRTANLDDFTRTGFINIGYKEANAELTPERLNSIEFGVKFESSRWRLELTPYYSKGSDFMHYVATGDSLFGGRKLVYKKQNISEVEIYGNELSLQYRPVGDLNIFANYTYSNSKVLKFEDRSEIVGNKLSYSPNHIANIGVAYRYKGLSFSAIGRYKSLYFTDELNESEIPEVITADLSAQYEFIKNLGVSVNVQNVLDKSFMVSSDQISLGRFITAELNYKF